MINPDLPADEWYEVYRKVSNRLLVALMRKKAEFYSLLNANAAQLINLPLPVGIQGDPFDDAAPDPGTVPETPAEDRDEDDEETPFSRSCKAELIDVGMPRRDTIECREQWVQLAQDIIRPTEGMPIPGYAYYIDEYLTMVREFFAGEPRAQAKAHKRIERLAELMAMAPQSQSSMPISGFRTGYCRSPRSRWQSSPRTSFRPRDSRCTMS